MFSYRLLGKAIVICMIVSSIILASSLFVIYSPELLESNFIVYSLNNEPVLIQAVVLCICGYLLCKYEQKRNDMKPAVYQNVLLQFLSQYGMLLLVYGLLIITYSESNFANRLGFSYHDWFLELEKSVLNPLELLSLWFRYAIQEENLWTYWLMYVVYGCTKSFYQLKRK